MSRPAENLAAGSAFGVVLVLFVACVFAEHVSPLLRHAKYLLPVVAFGITAPLVPPVAPFAFARRDLRGFVLLASIVVGASLALSLLRQAPMTRALEEAYFVMAPLLTAYVVFPSLRADRISVYADWLFIGIAAAYLVERGGAIAGALAHPEGIWIQMLTSSAGAESGVSFLFGLMALYYLCTGRRARALWAVGLVFMSFKRIAILGTLTCILVWGLIRITRFDVRRYWRFVAFLALATNALVLLILHRLSDGSLDEVVYRHTGLSSNWVTMGRASLYGAIFSRFELGWFGNGLGAITSFLESARFEIQNTHSDVVKYIVEVGPLLAAGWLWALYRLAKGSAAALLLVVFVNILFISDNVSIYFHVMFVLYVLIGFLSVRDETRSCSVTTTASMPGPNDMSGAG